MTCEFYRKRSSKLFWQPDFLVDNIVVSRWIWFRSSVKYKCCARLQTLSKGPSAFGIILVYHVLCWLVTSGPKGTDSVSAIPRSAEWPSFPRGWGRNLLSIAQWIRPVTYFWLYDRWMTFYGSKGIAVMWEIPNNKVNSCPYVPAWRPVRMGNHAPAHNNRCLLSILPMP